MNILLVDDNQVYLHTLKRIIIETCTRNSIDVSINTSNNPDMVLKEQLFLHNDIVLLDIDMPKMSGIELASKINEVKKCSDKPFIIFVTCMEGLVFEALKELPYSFVRKGYENELENIILSINNTLKTKKTYTIKVGKHIETLVVEEIVYLEKKNNYVVFHTISGEYRERVKLEEKYKDMASFGFVRPQIGYLVNIKYINDILLSSIVLDDGTQIPLSKKYRKTVKNDYFDWMVNRK